ALHSGPACSTASPTRYADAERERITSRRSIQLRRFQPATKLLQAAAAKPSAPADERDRACDEAGCNPAGETARSDEAHHHVRDESELPTARREAPPNLERHHQVEEASRQKAQSRAG